MKNLRVERTNDRISVGANICFSFRLIPSFDFDTVTNTYIDFNGYQTFLFYSFLFFVANTQTHTILLPPCINGTATIKTKYTKHILSMVHRRNSNELDNNKTALQRYDTIRYNIKLNWAKKNRLRSSCTVMIAKCAKKEDTTLLRYTSAYSSCSTGLSMSKSSTSWCFVRWFDWLDLLVLLNA